MLALLLTLQVGAEPLPAPASDTVVAWGRNDFGQTNVPAALNAVTALALGASHSVALKADGTLVAWGANAAGQSDIPAGLGGVKAIAAGGNYTVVVKADGTVAAWGDNTHGVTNVPAGLTGVTAVAAGRFGESHVLALKSDGTVVSWGWNVVGQANVPAGLSGVIAVAAGNAHSVVLKNDGTVVAWGLNNSGESSVPAGLNDVRAIAAGANFTVALKHDGTVVAWGTNGSGESSVPAGLSGVVAIAAGDTHTIAVKDDGAVVAWGSNGSGEATVPGNLAGATAVAAGGRHSAAIVGEGTVTGEPPTITTNPANAEIMAGQDATFTVVAAGAAPLSYQWYRTLGNTDPLPGETSATLTLRNVPFSDNGSTYYVTVTNENGAANSLPATLTVIPPPLLSSVSLIPLQNGAEGTNAARFSVVRAVTTAEAVDVALGYGGSATAGADYTAFPNPVRFPAGVGVVDIALPVMDDALVESTETIIVTVQPGTGYELGAPSTITLDLLDNDVAPARPVVKLVAVRNGAEGTNEARFTIVREVNLATAIDVAFAYSGTATPGLDYTPSPSPVRIPVNAGGADIALPVVNDMLVEGTETIVVTLQPGAAYELGVPASITLDVLDNDTVTFARTIRFGGGTAAPGTTVTVPVELVGDGQENAAAFSVNFATNALRFTGAALGANASGSQFLVVSNAAASGRVGLTIARSPGQRFAAGTNQLATLSFTLLTTAPGDSTPLTFGDAPFIREITDAEASLLPATFTAGAILITRGFEGDVAPRPNGNSTGSLTLADWVQVGRFFAGLDAGLSAGEFQRADVAPRATLGDGRLTLADWVQAGRYFAKLDAPLPAAGGPSAPAPASLPPPALARTASGTPDVVVTLRGADFVTGETNALRLELTSPGGVNALAGSFTVPVNLLGFVTARVSPAAEAAVPGGLLLNAVDFLPGHLGFALAASPGAVLPAGTLVLAEFDFVAQTLGGASLAFGDLPLDREVVDASGQTLASAYNAGEATVSVRSRGPLTAPAVSADGATLGFELSGEPGARFDILSSTDLKTWTLVEEVTVPVSGNASVNRPILPLDHSRYYRAVPRP